MTQKLCGDFEMKRKFRCIESEPIGFTVGQIYEVNERGEVKSNTGHIYHKNGCENAIEWLETKSLLKRKFEEVFDFG